MIETAFIIALTVLFLHATTWEGMINEWVAQVFHNAPSWVKKPVYDCPICMAPWWGFFIYVLLFIFGEIQYLQPINLVVMLFMAGGINSVLIYIISYAKDAAQAEE